MHVYLVYLVYIIMFYLGRNGVHRGARAVESALDRTLGVRILIRKHSIYTTRYMYI